MAMGRVASKMDELMQDFEVRPKNSSEEALKRWRKAAWLVLNPSRRFRNVADLRKRSEAELRKRSIQESVRVALYVHKAALQFTEAFKAEYVVSEEAKEAGFSISPEEVASLVSKHDATGLDNNGGVEGIAIKLSSSLDKGIDSSGVSMRQNIYGVNKFTEKPPRGFWLFVWEAFQDLTLIILMICAVVSIGVGIPSVGFPKGIYDGAGILVSIFLVVIVTATSDYNQSLQFRDLGKEKKKIFIQVTRDGGRQKVSIDDLVVGDLVHLSVGDIVPVDGIFISGYSLLVDESSLSGESEPVHVNKDRPFLLSGTKVLDGSGKMLVTSVGMRTEWGKLIETLNEAGDDETPLQVKLNGVATIIGNIGLVFAVLTFLVLAVRFLVDKALQNTITEWSSSDALTLLNYFTTAVTILVVAVPEGLPLAVTLSLAFAMKKLMNDRALVRHLSACETMGSTSFICTDKTGTLTTNHMVVHKVWIFEKEVQGNETSKDLISQAPAGVSDILLQAIFLNTSAEVVKDKTGEKSILGQPTESALLEFGLLLDGDSDYVGQKYKILQVEPFNSVRKKMSVLVEAPEGGKRAFCKGASEIVLRMCNRVINSYGNPVTLSEEQRKYVDSVINGYASEALRTLCLAYRDVDDGADASAIPEEGYTLIAVIGIKDPVRSDVKEAVQTCLTAGITVIMVTGDNIHTAKAIARECGIISEDGIAIEGPEFCSMTLEQMKEIVPRIQVMARSLPSDKYLLVHFLKSLEEVVAVTGDGTNDAPALRESDIGLAMGISGTEVAKENADVIILDDNFSTIVNVAKWGRAVYVNIQKFVQFQLTVNVVALMINFFSACITGSAPLTAVQLLWVNMIMDTLGALALATEPPNDELMKRPPVGRRASFISKPVWRNIIGQGIYQFAVLAALTFDGESLLGLSGSGASEILNTFIFNAFVFCQVFNEINSRDVEKINVFRGICSNWIFIGVLAGTVAFQAIIIEFLGSFASTVPLSWEMWLFSVLIGAVSIPISMLLKCIPVEDHATKNHHDGYEPLPHGPD